VQPTPGRLTRLNHLWLWTLATPARIKVFSLGGKDAGLDGRERATSAQVGSGGSDDEVG
jgi:hypothetical protein